MNGILEAFWFFLPAGIANAVPVLAKLPPVLRNWKTPMDFGWSFRGQRIFGTNKTWRGLVSGTVVGGLLAIMQHQVYPLADSDMHAFLIGAALGFGALIGDAVKSFFKRQRRIRPGNSWLPFDQIDYIIGGLLFVSLFVDLSFGFMLTVAAIYFLLHLIFSYLGYLVGLKDKPI